MLVTGSADRTAIIWDLNRRRAVHTLTGFDDGVHLIAVDECAGWIATACGADVWLWSINGRLIAHQSLHSISREPISSLAFSPREFHVDRLAVLITGHRYHIAIWSVVSRHQETTTSEPRWGLQCIRKLDAVSRTTALAVHDSRILAGDENGAVHCWALPGHAINVQSDTCLAGCGKKFGFLDTRRNCNACGGALCNSCATTSAAVGNIRLCNTCLNALSRDDITPMNTM